MQAARRSRLWRAGSRYASAVRWLALTLWAAFRWRVVGALAAAQTGVIVVGAALSLSLHYFQQLERGGVLRLRGLVLPARDETTLTIVVIVVLVVLLAGGGILFYAQRSIVSMAVELNHHVRMNIALAYGGELPAPSDWHSDRAVWRALWLLQTRDARRTAIVARGLLRNTVHLGIAVAGTAALFYLEPRMTVLFLGVMAVALGAYYRTNAESARATRRYEAVAPGTRKSLRRLLPSLQTLAQPSPDRAELEAALGREAITEETDAFRDRFGAHIHSELLGFIVMGVVLAGLTTFMGREALAGTMPWTRLIAYMLVLRITLNGVRSLLSAFAFFSRFYPSIDRLNRFFSATNRATSGEPLEALALRDGKDALTESQEMTRPIHKGEALEVVLPVGLSRYSLGLLAPVFAGNDRGRRRRLLGQTAMAAPLSVPPTATSMRSLLMLDGTWDERTLRERLGEHAAPVEDALGLDPTAVVPAEAWATLPEDAVARLVLVAAEGSERPVLALDRRLATSEELDRLTRQRTDKIVVVCSTGAPADHDGLGITRTVVASSRGDILAIGSPKWVAEHWEAIRDRGAEPAAAATGDDEDIDEE